MKLVPLPPYTTSLTRFGISHLLVVAIWTCVKWCLTEVLISISLMAHHVEPFCAPAGHPYVFGKMCIQVLCPFLSQVVFCNRFLLSSVYILAIYLYQIVCKYFLPCDHLFILLGSFAMQKVPSSLLVVPVVDFSLVACFWCHCQKLLPRPVSSFPRFLLTLLQF